MTSRLLIALCFFLPLTACNMTPAPHFVGDWHGKAVTELESTELVLHIVSSGNGQKGYISLPDIGVSRWPANSLRGDDTSLEVVIPSDSGEQTLSLHLVEDELHGDWQENRFKEVATVRLSRSDSVSTYTEKRLQIDGPAGVLGASFFSPTSCDGCSAVVMLHGSGPQPRDANRFQAIQYAEQGIASIIFDKRGVAESEGAYIGASFEDLAADGIAVAEFLRAQSYISQVGFYGHSQGGWIAPLAASKWSHSAFVITSAGPAVSPAREAQWDVVSALQKAGAKPGDVERAREIVELWHNGIRSGDWSEFENAVAEVEDSRWFKEVAHFQRRPKKEFIRTYRAFMDYQPIPVLSSLRVPMLAILAPEDESVDTMETAEILGELADQGQDIRIKLYPGYDHSLRMLGEGGNSLRWPSQPADLYEVQGRFIREFN